MARYEIIDDMTAYVAALDSLLGSIAADKKHVTIGVSGGSAVDITASTLEKLHSRGGVDKVDVFFCDERLVPDDDKESICGAYSKKNNLTSFCVFHKVNTQSSVDSAAAEYERDVRKFFNVPESSSEAPKFDCLLLGMGDDGHTCSLFPDHPVLKENSKLITGVCNSPKPPPTRVTMTFPLINAARNVVFLVRGQGKASAVKSILGNSTTAKSCLPAGLVQPTAATTVWLLDSGAASLLASSSSSSSS